MNIGFFSDDLKTISFHPGKSRYFIVASIDDARKFSGVKKISLCDTEASAGGGLSSPAVAMPPEKGFCKRFRGGHIEVSGGTLRCDKRDLFEGLALIVCRGVGYKLENIIKNSGAGLDITDQETIAGYLQNRLKLSAEEIEKIFQKNL